MIKVLHLMKNYAGNFPLTNAMIMGMDPSEFEVKICYISGKPDNSNLLDKIGCTIYMDIFNPDKSKIRTVMALAKILRSEKPDILHCHRHKATVYAVLAGLLANTPIKIISHVHGLKRTRSLSRRVLNRLMTAGISKFIAVSDAVKEDIVSSNWVISNSQVMTVRNGIDLDTIDSVSVSREEARIQMGISADEFVFGTVGRLAETKGHSYLIEAFAVVLKTIPDSKLVIVGDGPLHVELKKKTVDLGISNKVIFTGFRHDVLQLLRGFDAFVFSSVYEGLGMALIEAMASRLPVIASRVGGIPEVLDHGIIGRLVPAKDPYALAIAMEEIGILNEEKRKLIVDAARKWVETAFTAQMMCKHLVYVYETVIKEAA